MPQDSFFTRAGTLASADVHVWYVSRDLPAEAVAELASLLSPDERERAARYHFASDRARFVAGRGLLRLVLAAYLGLAPNALRFDYNAYGKPSPRPGEATDLAFSASGSGSLACFALTRAGALGVDIEHVRPDITLAECEQIAARFFSPAEQEMLCALPSEERRAAFFTAWTRKEAYLKARGVGLTQPLAQFTVSLDSARPALLDASSGDSSGDGSGEGEAARWQFLSIEPPTTYAAALVAERTPLPRQVICQEWTYPGVRR